MDKLLAKLSEQTAALSKQRNELKSTDAEMSYSRTVDYISSTNSSVPITPATEGFDSSNTAPTTSNASVEGDSSGESSDDVERLKKELEDAKGKIARMDQELAQRRITKHTVDQAIGPVSEADFSTAHSSEPSLYNQSVIQGIRPQYMRDNSWAAQQDDAQSDTSDALSASGFNRARNIWSAGVKPNFAPQGPGAAFQPSEALASSQFNSRAFGQPFVDTPMQFPGPPMNDLRDSMLPPIGPRRNNTGGSGGSGGRFTNRAPGSNVYGSSTSTYDAFTPAATSYNGSVGMGGPMSLNMSNGMAMPGSMFSSYQP